MDLTNKCHEAREAQADIDSMRHWNCARFSQCVVVLALLASVLHSEAQSVPTASRKLLVSSFVGFTDVRTGLKAGRNHSLTAGIESGHFTHGLIVGLDVRGRYPIDSGQEVAEKELEGGLRVQKRFRRVLPYADILIGRGDAVYQKGGYPVKAEGVAYLETYSTTISAGIGAEIELAHHGALFVDTQRERWGVPYGNTGGRGAGAICPIIGTFGFVYRFGH